MLRCSRGELPADLVLKNAVVLNVFTEELLPGDIAICGDTVVGVGIIAGGESWTAQENLPCPA